MAILTAEQAKAIADRAEKEYQLTADRRTLLVDAELLKLMRTACGDLAAILQAKKQGVTVKLVDAAMAEYRLAIETDPRATEQLARKYAAKIQWDAMRAAIELIWPVQQKAQGLEQPMTGAAVPEGWNQAYAAFVGAFDTPLARLNDDSEFANDARRRLRELNETLLADPR